MQIKTTMRHHYTPTRTNYIKKTDHNKCWQVCRNTASASGNINGTTTLEKSLTIHYKIKHHSPYDPAIPFLGIYQREIKTHVCTKICTWMFITALFVIAENWKYLKYPATGEWRNKLWYMHTILLSKKGNYWFIQHGWISKSLHWQNKEDTKEYIMYDSIYRKF